MNCEMCGKREGEWIESYCICKNCQRAIRAVNENNDHADSGCFPMILFMVIMAALFFFIINIDYEFTKLDKGFVCKNPIGLKRP